MKLELNYRLPNGARVIDHFVGPNNEDVVLARTDSEEYVTWRMNPSNKATYWGHYYGKDFRSASNDYLARSLSLQPDAELDDLGEDY